MRTTVTVRSGVLEPRLAFSKVGSPRFPSFEKGDEFSFCGGIALEVIFFVVPLHMHMKAEAVSGHAPAEAPEVWARVCHTS